MTPATRFRILGRFLLGWLTTVVVLPPTVVPAEAPSADVLTDQRRPQLVHGSRGMLNAWLAAEVDRALDGRLQQVEQLIDGGDVAAYQQQMRDVFLNALGGLPPRTPLRPRVTGTVDADGYRIEKVLYHSLPNFPVTANFYLPDGPGPYPGVLHSCGHSDVGKAAEAYQMASALLARNGIAVLCVDPLGQGERRQLAAAGVRGSTSEHLLLGLAPILLGRNLATTMIWDGIRGLDYLAQRPEIDADRLGCIGNSGGGMMTSYLMALDRRVVAAAPACFITDTRRKNLSPGPGDAEQNLFGQTKGGLDHADFLLMRAPRPTLILSATKDYVPIEGAWDSFRQAKRLYTRLGHPERVELVEVNERHGFSPGLRVAAVRWMSRWLLHRDQPLHDELGGPLEPPALHVTPTGSVLDLDGARSYFDLVAEAVDEATVRRENRNGVTPQEIRDLLGLAAVEELKAVEVLPAGQVMLDDIRWEKRIYLTEPGIGLPALVAMPEGQRRGVVLRVDGGGKADALADSDRWQRRLQDGWSVCLVDLRGYGETATPPWRYRAVSEALGDNSAEAFIALMLGRSLVEMRCGDLLRAAAALRDELADAVPLHLEARGHAAVAALHAAALQRDWFARVDIAGGPQSWSELCNGPVRSGAQLENVVHGALQLYDLPDLRRIIDRND